MTPYNEQKCGYCNGTGNAWEDEYGGDVGECRRCNGTGKASEPKPTVCPKCTNGFTGVLGKTKCWNCNGTGRVLDTEPKGLTGNLIGMKINHQSNVGDTREHIEPSSECWCWKPEPQCATPDTKLEAVVSRLEIIDHTKAGTGRDFVKREDFHFKVRLSYQDKGHTLKIFLTDYEEDDDE